MRPARGFTLVEVMVALAIVALTLPALLVSVNRQADDTAYLRDKTLAQMVAANRLSETRLAVAAARAISPGRDSGMARMAERDWFWWSETRPAPGGVANFFRVEIVVAAREERRNNPLYTLVAFLSGDFEEEIEVPPGGGNNDNDSNNDDNDSGDGNDGNTVGGVPDVSSQIPPPEDHLEQLRQPLEGLQ